MEKVVTVRIPVDLSDRLSVIAKALGLSKNAMLRVAIIKYLDVEEIKDFNFVAGSPATTQRYTLPLTPILQKIVEEKEADLHTSVNSLIIYACQKIVDHYADFLA